MPRLMASTSTHVFQSQNRSVIGRNGSRNTYRNRRQAYLPNPRRKLTRTHSAPAAAIPAVTPSYYEGKMSLSGTIDQVIKDLGGEPPSMWTRTRAKNGDRVLAYSCHGISDNSRRYLYHEWVAFIDQFKSKLAAAGAIEECLSKRGIYCSVKVGQKPAYNYSISIQVHRTDDEAFLNWCERNRQALETIRRSRP